MTSKPFLFKHYTFDDATGLLRLCYAYEDGEAFEEHILFPLPSHPLSPDCRKALEQAFRLLFLLAGVSYYKARVPPQLKCEAFSLDKTTAAFIEKVYRNGLGEFSYVNQLDLRDRIQLACEDAPPPSPVELKLAHHHLVPVGGGKDSIVTLECLKKSDQPITLFGLGGTSGLALPIQGTIDRSGLQALRVARTLSPNLAALNKAGAYNGHVPITAILSAIAVASALLQGIDTVVLSNEHSASAPNLYFNNLEINHQYSKSFAFEKDFSQYIHQHITPQLHYFSFLRPLTEAAITRRFSQHDKYFDVFRSCNTAFRQDDAQRNRNWCGNCPKCRFVFLALAPFIVPEKLITIFGKNMLDDPAQEQGFAELCGRTAFKPFECVGEIEESSLLMQKLFRMPTWQNFFIVGKLGQELATNDHAFDAAYAALFTLQPDHGLSPTYMKILDACA